MLLARRSTRTLSVQSSALLGTAKRAWLRTDRARTTAPAFSSRRETRSHSVTDLGQARVPVPYASRACGNLFCGRNKRLLTLDITSIYDIGRCWSYWSYYVVVSDRGQKMIHIRLGKE